MTTDLRALCARMADELDEYRQLLLDDRSVTHRLADEARTALAEPEPVGPTDEELMELLPEDLHKEFANWSRIYAEQAGIKPGLFRVVLNTHTVDFARAVLARWGRPAPVPADSEEVEELVEWLHGQDGGVGRRAVYSRIADLLVQRHGC